MANVQKQFEAFDENIRLGRFDENKTLRDKRDIIRNKLKSRLPEVFNAHNEVCPEFSFRDQGSYEMGTGIKPLIDGDYDIDQGLYFAISIIDYPDPVVIKQRILEALENHTKEVRIRQPCVTVFYQQDGESAFHVDIAVYSDGAKNGDGRSRLARGKEYSLVENRRWEVSNSQGISDAIFNRFKGNDREQFRRVVRYLKRWKCENFSGDGHEAPVGISLTIAAFQHLQVTYADLTTYKADDLGALYTLVSAMLNSFTFQWDTDDNQVVSRLSIKLPVEPWSDLFEQMTNQQMSQFKVKLENLQKALKAAMEEVDPVEACVKLQKVFGMDFPVPAKEETAKRHASAIISSSNSA